MNWYAFHLLNEKILFNIFIEHQFKRVLKYTCVCSFYATTMHYISNVLVKKKKKEEPNNWKRKITIALHNIGC
jgi:hypothetical protein